MTHTETRNHLRVMSDILHAIAHHKGRIEYAAQLAGKVSCTEQEFVSYTDALRSSGYLEGTLLDRGSSLVQRKSTTAGLGLTMQGYEHVDAHRQTMPWRKDKSTGSS